MKIVALYARVSSKKQALGNTIASQIAELKDRISNDGHELLDEYKFIDNGISGSTLEREGLEKLRDIVAEGKIDKIYIHSPDRLSRKSAYQAILIEEFQKAGLEIVFLNCKFEDNPESNMFLGMQGLVAEYERAKIMERNRRGKLHAARKGSISVMGNAPYGYRYIKRNEIGGESKFEINEEEAEIIRKLFVWIGEERVSIREAARRFTEMSIITQKGGKNWSVGTIHKMLKNPAYKGQAAFGKTKVGSVRQGVKVAWKVRKKSYSVYRTDKENWIYIKMPSIINEVLFNVVQEQMAENKQRARVQRRKETYLLQGLVMCQRCKHAYCGMGCGSEKRRGVHRYYRCTTANASRYNGKICDNKSIRTDILEIAVWEEVKSLLKKPERIINEYQRRLSEHENNGSQDETFEKQESKIKRYIAKLIDSYAQEYITKEEFEPRVKEMRQRLKEIEEQKERMFDKKKLQQELNLAISSIKNFSANIESTLDQVDWQTKQSIIRDLVKQVEISLDNVEIVWRIKELANPPQERRNQNMQHCRRIPVSRTGMTLEGSGITLDRSTDLFPVIPVRDTGIYGKNERSTTGMTSEQIEELRKKFGIKQVYKRVDTCAAEFESSTAYMYGCYEGDVENKTECEASISNRNKVVILGSGPNRIGQGIEFDYACVHAVSAAKEMGYETIMINCNPETVSTDYDTADRLYFAPLIAEDVLEILNKEQEDGTLVGVIVQIGGQTPLKLAKVLNERGFNILGTSFDSIDLAEDRMRFKNLALELNLKQPENSICHSVQEALINAEKVEFPLVVRPSYVLGGQSMSIRHDIDSFKKYVLDQTKIFEHGSLLLDKFLVNAVEIDVDAICDGETVFIAAIMEHIEEAGIHSGDSTCSIPTNTLSSEIIKEIKLQTERIALALKVIGLINIQFAIQENNIYVLEVNLRASRTVPFISKVINIPIAKLATQVILGKKLNQKNKPFDHFAVKAAVFPFTRFAGVDTLLGPEMKSTGEVMGIDSSFEAALAKAHMAAGYKLPTEGTALISVKDDDKEYILPVAQVLKELGFEIYATKGTALYLNNNGISAKAVNKVREGRPHIVDMIKDGKINLVINTSKGVKSVSDSKDIRRAAILQNIAYSTTASGSKALVLAIQHIKNTELKVKPLQEYFR